MVENFNELVRCIASHFRGWQCDVYSCFLSGSGFKERVLTREWSFIVGLIGTILVLKLLRRVVGWPMIIVAALFMLYALIGPYIPGILGHRGVSMQELIGHICFS